MHCKNLRSEYMKRFKDPHWDAYRKCYEEMLRYRLSRRLLEHAHNPWLWEGWERTSDSSSGHSTPPAKPLEEAGAPEKVPDSAHVALKLPLSDDSTKAQNSHVEDHGGQTGGSHLLGQEKNRNSDQKPEDEKSVSRSRTQQSRRATSAKDGQKSRRSPAKMSLSIDRRHPFALYACGERKKDTAGQKTHNVCAPAQENEIHESALRAKNRRQREKRRQTSQKQRARSADAGSAPRRKASSADNPWMTEYMRCYSARTC